MKKIQDSKYFTAAEYNVAADKKHIRTLLVLIAALLTLSVLLCGSIISFAKTIYASENKNDSEDELNIIQLYSEISEENKKKLEEFDENIKEKDVLIKDIENKISESAETPEDKLYVDELYDKQIKALFDKYEMCAEYSEICAVWSEEARILIADSVAQYENYLTLYKERLALNYEIGMPDRSEIFSTSENIIDFITGEAAFDELKIYDEELRIKVEELYSVVADGLEVVKYYITKADDYSKISLAAYDDLKKISEKSVGYLENIISDKDVYNYYLLSSAENQQKLAKELSENIKEFSGTIKDDPTKFIWPLGTDFFYTDYMGKGHGSRYEWSTVLGKYVNINHSGIDIYTSGINTEVLAASKGVVIYSDYCPIKGYTIALLHAGNAVTVYSHCTALKAEVGSIVEAGDVIALSGISGDADTAMIGFEVFVKGQFVDPADYIILPDVSLSEN
ncbi:MAG: M23 family metallopeptidase [Ruminococcaceae bacterium]|nr:M23 family metallopeptidase [Oscillospiraceae bacterium]